ncbi:hypothetical protein HNR30_008509 [Nonomuraea soli]|uniref:Uncharacterized protein n=2 Tax=Nonomuraea soli TaxID=1032476 RepID=A0A7W0HVE8_9ACTN|nr:hypothetical protein [Nonomuraea soli]
MGRWGAANPFHLVWHDSHVARRHLVGYDRPEHRLRDWGPAVTVDDLLRLFAEAGITVTCPDGRPGR